MANDSPETSTTTGTKSRNLRYTYRDADGVEQESFTRSSRSVITTIIASGEKVETSISDLVEDASVAQALAEDAPMAIMAMLFGLKTTIGNAVTAVKNGDADDMLAALATRRATIVEDKEWREGGATGPRTGHIVEAVAAILTQQTGKPLSEAGLALLKEEVKKSPKSFTDDPTIAAEIAAANMRRAQEQLAKKQAAAANAAGKGSILDGLKVAMAG